MAPKRRAENRKILSNAERALTSMETQTEHRRPISGFTPVTERVPDMTQREHTPTRQPPRMQAQAGLESPAMSEHSDHQEQSMAVQRLSRALKETASEGHMAYVQYRLQRIVNRLDSVMTKNTR